MRPIDDMFAKKKVDEILHKYERLRGKTVTLTRGKYKGRKAVIEGFSVDNTHGITFLCMVLRAVPTGGCGAYLNSDGESRAYRPAHHFE